MSIMILRVYMRFNEIERGWFEFEWVHNGENESINDSFHDFHFQFDGKKEIICE